MPPELSIRIAENQAYVQALQAEAEAAEIHDNFAGEMDHWLVNADYSDFTSRRNLENKRKTIITKKTFKRKKSIVLISKFCKWCFVIFSI